MFCKGGQSYAMGEVHKVTHAKAQRNKESFDEGVFLNFILTKISKPTMHILNDTLTYKNQKGLTFNLFVNCFLVYTYIINY